MSKIIKIKRGLKAGLPNLNVGEFGYATDTKELYLGTDTGNEILNPDLPDLPELLSATVPTLG